MLLLLSLLFIIMLFLCLVYFKFCVCFIIHNFLCCCFFTLKICCMLLMILYCIDDLVLYYCVLYSRYCIIENWKFKKYYSKSKSLKLLIKDDPEGSTNYDPKEEKKKKFWRKFWAICKNNLTFHFGQLLFGKYLSQLFIK